MVLRETGEPLDAVQSYANFTLQNSTLESKGLERLRKAGVGVVANGSPLGMGLLRRQGVPMGAQGDHGDFHPSGKELRNVVADAARWVEGKGERLEVVAIRWALEKWARVGAGVGGVGAIGVSVMGVSKVEELEETIKVWHSILDGLPGREELVEKKDREWSLSRRREVDEIAEGVWKILGKWKDYTWASPDENFVNLRAVKGVLDEAAPIPVVKDDVSKVSRL